MLIEEIYVRAAQASAGLTVGQMKMIRKLKTYRHALWFLLYSAFYMTAFSAVEKAGHVHYHVIHTWLDEQIPFCRFFVVPYFLWFGFIGAAVTWFVMCCKNKDEYYKLITMLMMGMTIFIVVSVVYPNRLDLRPAQVSLQDRYTDECAAEYPCVQLHGSLLCGQCERGAEKEEVGDCGNGYPDASDCSVHHVPQAAFHH